MTELDREENEILDTSGAGKLNAGLVVLVLAALAWSTQVRPKGPCEAEGEPIQWVADYCMLTMETDDEIVVSDCIEEERKKAFSDDCASNLHFKEGMCETMIRSGTKAGTVDQCVKDPTFKGRVVEAGGVGERPGHR